MSKRKNLDWNGIGQFLSALLEVFGIIRDTLKPMKVGIEIIPWLLIGEGKEFFIEGLKTLGKKFLETSMEGSKKDVDKFIFFADLGKIVVPNDYEHATRLALFEKNNRKKFYDYNDNITDGNFPNPSRILKPGDSFFVYAFKQSVQGTTTKSEERMAFLNKIGAVHVGAQGATLLFEQKREKLPNRHWYTFMDDPSRLWKDADGHRRVPRVIAYSGGDFNFNLGYFEDVWHDVNILVVFCDKPLEL